MQGAAAEPVDASWAHLSSAEVSRLSAAYPGPGDHAQIYDGVPLRATLRRLAALTARQELATRDDVCDGLPAALQFVRDQLRVPESDPQLGSCLIRLEEDLPRIAEALLEGGSSSGADDGGLALVAIAEAAVAAACAAAAAPVRLPADSCLVCAAGHATGACLEAFVLSCLLALVATALISVGVEAEAIMI